MDRFVGEQEKMSKVLIFPEKKDKNTVEQGNFHLPPDFGAALACRSTEGSQKLSTRDPASLLAVDKLLMDPITAKSCIALLFADGREAALGNTENCIQTKAGLQKCSFFQQGGNVEEQQKATGHGTVSYADVLKRGIHPNETDEPGTCEAHMCNELNTDKNQLANVPLEIQDGRFQSYSAEQKGMNQIDEKQHFESCCAHVSGSVCPNYVSYTPTKLLVV